MLLKCYIGQLWTRAMRNLLKNCTKCADFQRKQLSGPLSPTETPKLPFVMVGTDLFEFESKTYFLTVYNYSKFIEVERLQALERKAIKKVPNSADMAYLKKYKVMGVRSSLIRILQDSALTMALPIRLWTPPTPTANGEAKRALQTESVSGKKSLISKLPSWTTGEPHWKESTCNQHSY